VSRRLVAFVVLAVVTAFMWSDIVIEWWQSILDFFLSVNEDVTESVLESRPGNDADLHVLVWAAVGGVFTWAFRSRRLVVLALLIVWSALVETMQPVFTDIRSRQVADYMGNAIGIALVALMLGLISSIRRRTQPNSPAK
jgi:hypothetical protein